MPCCSVIVNALGMCQFVVENLMIKSYCIHPTSHFCESDNTQAVIGSLGQMVVWWPSQVFSLH